MRMTNETKHGNRLWFRSYFWLGTVFNWSTFSWRQYQQWYCAKFDLRRKMTAWSIAEAYFVHRIQCWLLILYIRFVWYYWYWSDYYWSLVTDQWCCNVFKKSMVPKFKICKTRISMNRIFFNLSIHYLALEWLRCGNLNWSNVLTYVGVSTGHQFVPDERLPRNSNPMEKTVLLSFKGATKTNVPFLISKI